MPFTPIFEEVADTLIFDNILKIVKDDFKASLDRYWPLENLPDFTERTLGRFFKLSYPTFSVDPDRHGPQQSADGSRVDDAVRVQLFLAVSAADEPTTIRLAAKYVTALKSILRKAERTGAYVIGFPANSMLPLTVEMSYQYGLINKNATGYEKPVNFELLLNFGQR